MQASDFDSHGYSSIGYSITGRFFYEYNPIDAIGLLTGVGLDFRTYLKQDRSNYSFEDEEQYCFGLVVPVMVQARLNFFSFEGGLEFSSLFLNQLELEAYEQNSNPLIETNALLGIRFRIDRGLSLGFNFRWGLTPILKSSNFSQYSNVDFAHRGLVVGFRYLVY